MKTVCPDTPDTGVLVPDTQKYIVEMLCVWYIVPVYKTLIVEG